MEVPLNECRNSYQLNHLLHFEFRRDSQSKILLRFRVLSFGTSLIVQLRAGAAPAMPSPGYQGRVDEFLRYRSDAHGELAPMLEVALAAKRSRQTTELVWTGPATPVVPVRRTEQVLCDLIRGAERRLTMTSFGIFQVPRLVEEL